MRVSIVITTKNEEAHIVSCLKSIKNQKYPKDKIEIIVHPQSIIHSMVEFIDGSIKAQLGFPDMRIPIQYALTYPERREAFWHELDFTGMSNLTFLSPDFDKFPCISLAYEALETGGTLPAVLNAANEAAVDLFLKKYIKFTDIPKTIEKAMRGHNVVKNPSLEELIDADKRARNYVKDFFVVN